MQTHTTTTEAQSSIEISRGVKGAFSWSVKVYDDDPAHGDLVMREFIERVRKIISDEEGRTMVSLPE